MSQQLKEIMPLPKNCTRFMHLNIFMQCSMVALTLGYVSTFFRKELLIFWSHISVVIGRFLRLGSFPAWWQEANATAILKGPPSSSVNGGPISRTPILSKVFKRRLVSVRLGQFVECRGVLPTIQFAHRRCIVTCDALLCVSHTLHNSFEEWAGS